MSVSAGQEDQMTAPFSLIRRWLDCRRARSELASFSERDLADLDLVGCDVKRIASARSVRRGGA
ncbi:DUF1127 domain-containing protein [Methylobacterium sp. Leaf361]|jgi:uncharacterized protein YjiS (DUF1127 family)|nr:hypothetical protein ASG32_22130 [Methylobacterium sp. Leaf361]